MNTINHTTTIKVLSSKTCYVNHFALRQCPNGDAQWHDAHLEFNPDSRDYDWLVVYHDLPNPVEMLACPRAQTILVTHEPSAIKTYGADFCRQFGYALTCHPEINLPHPRRISMHPGSMWIYGADFYEAAPADKFSYNNMRWRPPPQKNKLISTVCSDKKQKHTLHFRRYLFTQAIKARISAMEIFGHGVRQINQKADALDDYRYHLTIENVICPHHWTEKLADAFLGFCLPFYIGAPNAADYFPPQSFIPLDINDIDGATKTIQRAIDNNEYEKRLPHIIEARRRVMEEHNLYAMLARTIINLPAIASNVSHNEKIYSRRALVSRNPFVAARYLREKWTTSKRAII